MKTEFETDPQIWHNTRPHSEECLVDRHSHSHTEGRRALHTGPCRVASCPHGQPWPTFRINPADPPLFRNWDAYHLGPVLPDLHNFSQ